MCIQNEKFLLIPVAIVYVVTSHCHCTTMCGKISLCYCCYCTLLHLCCDFCSSHILYYYNYCYIISKLLRVHYSIYRDMFSHTLSLHWNNSGTFLVWEPPLLIYNVWFVYKCNNYHFTTVHRQGMIDITACNTQHLSITLTTFVVILKPKKLVLL